jgi:hypothetical protein
MIKTTLVATACLTLILSAAYGQQRRNPPQNEHQAIDQLAATAQQLSPQGQVALASKLVANMQFFVANKGKAHKPTCMHANLTASTKAYTNAQAVVLAGLEFCGSCAKEFEAQREAAKAKR